MPLDSYTTGPYLGTSRNPYSYEKIEQINRDIQTQWLTLEEITDQLNLFGDTSQDTYLTNLELATRMAIEDFLGMTIFYTQWKVYYGSYVGMTGTQVMLDLPEVSQANQNNAGTVINDVSYYDSGNPPNLISLPSTSYYYDPTGNKVVVNGLPDSASLIMTNPIIVTYTTNASPLANYPVIKQAGLLLLTHLYNKIGRAHV